jgi:hypothetical protein
MPFMALPDTLIPFIESANQAISALITTGTPLILQVPPSIELPLRATTELTTKVFLNLEILCAEPSLNLSYISELVEDLETLRDYISDAATALSDELTPPALKRFIEQ